MFRCPFFIKECDIYFRAGTDLDFGFFEDLPVATQKQTVAAHHKFCQGHESNTWGHDLSGNMNREVTQQTFNQNNGPVWPREREEDAALYGVAGSAALKSPPSGPFILPKRSSVIDAGWLKPPIYDVTRSAAAKAFQYDAIVLTNLKGFSNGKDLRMWIYRGKSTKPANLIVGPLRGSSIDRKRSPLNGRPVFARYHPSTLAIGRKADWDKLMLTVKRAVNMDKLVKGRGFDFAQEVTIVVSGFLTEKGGRKKTSNVYTIVYNELEERDPVLPRNRIGIRGLRYVDVNRAAGSLRHLIRCLVDRRFPPAGSSALPAGSAWYQWPNRPAPCPLAKEGGHVVVA